MAAVALLRPAPDRPQAPAALTPAQALDLGLLAVTLPGPLPVERVAGLLQRIAAPLLQPTMDVIEGRLSDLERRGLLMIAVDPPCLVRRTAAGARYLRRLLRMPSPSRGAAHHDLAFMLKACLLDVLVEDDRTAVLDELRQDLHTALSTAEHVARHCSSSSPFAHHWLGRQVARLRDDLLWLDSLKEVGSRAPAAEMRATLPCPTGR